MQECREPTIGVLLLLRSISAEASSGRSRNAWRTSAGSARSGLVAAIRFDPPLARLVPADARIQRSRGRRSRSSQIGSVVEIVSLESLGAAAVELAAVPGRGSVTLARMTDEALWELMHSGLRAWIRLVAVGAPSSKLFERPGITASVCPAVPERAVLNSAAYGVVAELDRSLDELMAVYDAADVAASAIWVPWPDTPRFERGSAARDTVCLAATSRWA